MAMPSLRIYWRGSFVGTIADTESDMGYLEARWSSAATPAARDFEAVASTFDPKLVSRDPTKGTRVLLLGEEEADSSGTHAVVISLADGHLLLRCVFVPEAVQWLIANVE